MKAKLTLILLLAFFLFAGWVGFAFLAPDPLQPIPIRSATPQQAGLIWRECELPILDQSGNAAAPDESFACFGQSLPVRSEEDKRNSGQNAGRTSVTMSVGSTAFSARADELAFLTVYTLSKNNGAVKGLVGLGDTMWLRMFLWNVDGHVAWGIANQDLDTIVYNGKDLRNVYGLDKAQAPYGLNERLIWVARKDGKSFVMYDGQKIGQEFEQIIVAYCCETSLYSVQAGQGRYQFRGTRAGKNYIVEISSAKDNPL
jgi:hypothetical protein